MAQPTTVVARARWWRLRVQRGAGGAGTARWIWKSRLRRPHTPLLLIVALRGRQTHRDIFKRSWLRSRSISAGSTTDWWGWLKTRQEISTWQGRAAGADVILGLGMHPTTCLCPRSLERKPDTNFPWECDPREQGRGTEEESREGTEPQ